MGRLCFCYFLLALYLFTAWRRRAKREREYVFVVLYLLTSRRRGKRDIELER